MSWSKSLYIWHSMKIVNRSRGFVFFPLSSPRVITRGANPSIFFFFGQWPLSMAPALFNLFFRDYSLILLACLATTDIVVCLLGIKQPDADQQRIHWSIAPLQQQILINSFSFFNNIFFSILYHCSNAKEWGEVKKKEKKKKGFLRRWGGIWNHNLPNIWGMLAKY